MINDLLGVHAEELVWYQMILRAVFIFIVALICIRITGMRSFGAQSAFDIVFSITIGGVLSRGITGHYPFIPVLLAALTLTLCHKAIALMSRNSTIRKITEGSPVCLFKDGKLLNQELKRYSINETDILSALHASNLEDYSKVKAIWYEPNGQINVINK
jgi:uncharacterized membrane protein YcaP (DUF421 family)